MRNQKGFSLTELLIVIAVLAFVILLLVPPIMENIYKAQGTVQVSKARVVFVSAESVMIYSQAWSVKITDEDYMLGLTGVVNDAANPSATMVSEKLVELNAPDLTFSEKPQEDAATVSFTVKNGRIESMVYETISYGKLFTVTINKGSGQAELKYSNLP